MEPPAYSFPTIAGSASAVSPPQMIGDKKYYKTINITFESGNVKNDLAIFCNGKSYEESNIIEKSYFDRTEYHLDFEISLGLIRMIFTKFKGNNDEADNIISFTGINSFTGLISQTNYYSKRPYVISNNPPPSPLSTYISYDPTKDCYEFKKEGIICHFHYYTTSDLLTKKETRDSLFKAILKRHIKEEFYIGPPLTETELDIIKQAKKILDNIGKTL